MRRPYAGNAYAGILPPWDLRTGGKIVPVTRFFDGLRPANGIIAGLTGMPWPKFLALSVVGAALWVAGH